MIASERLLPALPYTARATWTTAPGRRRSASANGKPLEAMSPDHRSSRSVRCSLSPGLPLRRRSEYEGSPVLH